MCPAAEEKSSESDQVSKPPAGEDEAKESVGEEVPDPDLLASSLEYMNREDENSEEGEGGKMPDPESLANALEYMNNVILSAQKSIKESAQALNDNRMNTRNGPELSIRSEKQGIPLKWAKNLSSRSASALKLAQCSQPDVAEETSSVSDHHLHSLADTNRNKANLSASLKYIGVFGVILAVIAPILFRFWLH